MPADLTSLDDAALESLWVQVLTEQSRRMTLARAAEKVAEIQAAFIDARDRPAPAASRTKVADWPGFVQPQGAHDAYPRGKVVADAGRLYRASRADGAPSSHVPSTTPAEWLDVTWELLPALKPTGPAPWSATATYAVGDRCTRNGRLWQCLVAHGAAYGGTWGPPAVGVWSDIGAA